MTAQSPPPAEESSQPLMLIPQGLLIWQRREVTAPQLPAKGSWVNDPPLISHMEKKESKVFLGLPHIPGDFLLHPFPSSSNLHHHCARTVNGESWSHSPWPEDKDWIQCSSAYIPQAAGTAGAFRDHSGSPPSKSQPSKGWCEGLYCPKGGLVGPQRANTATARECAARGAQPHFPPSHGRVEEETPKQNKCQVWV